MMHHLKIWPHHWEDVFSDLKRFEVRLPDRDFAIGDQLALWHYDPGTCLFSADRPVLVTMPIIRCSQIHGVTLMIWESLASRGNHPRMFAVQEDRNLPASWRDDLRRQFFR